MEIGHQTPSISHPQTMEKLIPLWELAVSSLALPIPLFLTQNVSLQSCLVCTLLYLAILCRHSPLLIEKQNPAIEINNQ